MVFQTWQFIVVALAGWLNRQQQDIVAYLAEENRVLREQLKGKRIRFTDDQRRRLDAKEPRINKLDTFSSWARARFCSSSLHGTRAA